MYLPIYSNLPFPLLTSLSRCDILSVSIYINGSVNTPLIKEDPSLKTLTWIKSLIEVGERFEDT